MSLVIKKVCIGFLRNQEILIKNLTFEVKKGKTITLMGPSGCGKSTFLSYICGSLSSNFQANGEIFLDNHAYRYSNFMKNKEIITEVVFQFQPSSSEQIEKLQSKILKKRKTSQPIHQSTWGSVFKNPKGAYAAELIEKCGLKGKIYGKLEVSQKHSNFFVNLGGASFKDIETAFLTIQKAVWQKFKIFLEPEVRIIDPYGEIIQKYYSRYF